MKTRATFSLGQVIADLGPLSMLKDAKIEVETEYSVEDAIQSAKTLPEMMKNLATATPTLKSIIVDIFDMIKAGDRADHERKVQEFQLDNEREEMYDAHRKAKEAAFKAGDKP